MGASTAADKPIPKHTALSKRAVTSAGRSNSSLMEAVAATPKSSAPRAMQKSFSWSVLFDRRAGRIGGTCIGGPDDAVDIDIKGSHACEVLGDGHGGHIVRVGATREIKLISLLDAGTEDRINVSRYG